MINLLLFLFFLTCVGVSASWLAENPGNVIIHWFGYRIDTSFAFLMLLALIAAVVLAYVYMLLRHVALVPEYMTKHRSLKQYKKGLAEITYSVAALAAADTKEALQRNRNAEKFLGKTPLTLLLSAQIARSEGDDEKTRMLLSQMLEHKETEYLAARSLSETANKQHLFPKALALAKRAHALNAKGIAPLLSLHIRLGEWHQAMHAITKSTRKAQLTRNEIKHYKAMVLLKEGMKMLESGHHDAALSSARKALSLQPAFVPAIAFTAKCYDACGKKNTALKMIYKAWKAFPNQQLSEEFRLIIAKDTKEQQIKMVRKLMSFNPNSNESDIALAQTAMRHRDFATARQSLNTALDKSETVRTCKLLAALEELEYPDFDISSKWIARSTSAAHDPAWVCSSCGKDSAMWDAHCGACEAFDSLEWKKRDMAFTG